MATKEAYTSNTDHIVFVYGTLLSGYSNHYLLNDSQFIDTGRTVNKYALYFQILPYVVKESVSYIHGELYKVNSSTFENIDWIEDHPSWYQREEVEILTDNKQVIIAWLYFCSHKTGTLIKSGRYKP